MRLSFLSVCIAAVIAAAVVGAARAMHSPVAIVKVRALRVSVDHYRTVAWLFQRAARQHPTPTSFSYRRSTDPAYLQWTLTQWQKREYVARLHAVAALQRRLDLRLPRGPGIHAALARRIAYSRTLTLRLQQIADGRSSARALAGVRALPATQQLYRWQVKAAAMTLKVSHTPRLTLIAPHWLTGAFTCIHHYEGAWNANSGNGYYGGLQMNYGFMTHYGPDYVHRWGTADNWPAWAQIDVAVRAYRSGRGFWPWPNTARACGLL